MGVSQTGLPQKQRAFPPPLPKNNEGVPVGCPLRPTNKSKPAERRTGPWKLPPNGSQSFGGQASSPKPTLRTFICVWVKIKPTGDRRFFPFNRVPFNRVPFVVPIDPQPFENNLFAQEASNGSPNEGPTCSFSPPESVVLSVISSRLQLKTGGICPKESAARLNAPDLSKGQQGSRARLRIGHKAGQRGCITAQSWGLFLKGNRRDTILGDDSLPWIEQGAMVLSPLERPTNSMIWVLLTCLQRLKVIQGFV